MARKPSPALIAHKIINLANDLTASEKRVAAFLIDSFNFETGQCDPGVDTMSRLLELHRRTVIRVTNSLARKCYIVKVRHGGYFRRNCYQPNWRRFRLQNDAWSARRKMGRFSKVQHVSPKAEQGCHSNGDNDATQTNPLKQIPETSISKSTVRTGRREHSSGVESDVEMRNSEKTLVFSEDCALSDTDRGTISSCFNELRRRIGADVYRSWFGKSRIEGLVDRNLVLSVNSAFIKSRIERDYVLVLEQLFCSWKFGTPRICIIVEASH